MIDINPTQLILGVLTHDALRYALGAGGTFLLINTLLARRLAQRKIRPPVADWLQIRREVLTSARTVLIFAATGVLISLGSLYGLIPIYNRIEEFGWTYLIGSLAVIIVAHDAWFYWTHRMLHHRRLFRWAHRTHHRSHNPTPFASYAFDTSEAALNALFLPVFVMIIPMHPMALLIFVLHMMLRNAIGHCGYEIFPARSDGRPLCDWLTTVTHHDQHHANGRYNLGLYFTWWDRWLGTEHPDYHAAFARVAPLWPRPNLKFLRLVILTALLCFAATLPHAQDLRGVYASPYLGAVVRFEPCATTAAETCGRLLWGWDMSDWRHGRRGDLIITGLTRAAGGWTEGRLKHPETGLVFRGQAAPLRNGDIELRGCAGPFCTRQIWRPLGALQRELSALN